MNNQIRASELELYLYSPCNQNKNGYKYGAHANTFEQALEYAMVYEEETNEYGISVYDSHVNKIVLIAHDYWTHNIIHINPHSYYYDNKLFKH